MKHQLELTHGIIKLDKLMTVFTLQSTSMSTADQPNATMVYKFVVVVCNQHRTSNRESTKAKSCHTVKLVLENTQSSVEAGDILKNFSERKYSIGGNLIESNH